MGMGDKTPELMARLPLPLAVPWAGVLTMGCREKAPRELGSSPAPAGAAASAPFPSAEKVWRRGERRPASPAEGRGVFHTPNGSAGWKSQ